MSLVLDEHREFLADSHRIAAFSQAIAATVRPGDVVVDLASGTGILGLLACRAGAARVYALEVDGIAGLARELATANGFGERITVVREHSTRAVLPERGDVLLTDQIGRFGFEAGLFTVIADAAARHLKSGARLVPAEIAMYVAPVECGEVRERLRFWHNALAAFDWTPAQRIARNTGYPIMLDAGDLLADAAEIYRGVLPAAAAVIRADATFTMTRAATLDGVAGWFGAALSSGVWMTNDPRSTARINRRNVVLPLPSPVAVQRGDVVETTLRILPDRGILAWNVRVRFADGRPGVVCRASTFEGMLMSHEDIDATRPGARLRLTRSGEARRAVIDRIDGVRSVAEIENEVRALFPDLFTDDSMAAEFVAEVLTPYAR